MQLNSALESDKHGDYHLLPDLESSSPLETDLKNERRQETLHKEAAEDESHRQRAAQGFAAHWKTRINNYALGGAILASTNSVLLGYGEFSLIISIQFLFICSDFCTINIKKGKKKMQKSIS